MDRFLGSVPRKFIALRLESGSEECETSSISVGVIPVRDRLPESEKEKETEDDLLSSSTNGSGESDFQAHAAKMVEKWEAIIDGTPTESSAKTPDVPMDVQPLDIGKETCLLPSQIVPESMLIPNESLSVKTNQPTTSGKRTSLMSEDSLEVPSSRIVQDSPMDLSLPNPDVTPVDLSLGPHSSGVQFMAKVSQLPFVRPDSVSASFAVTRTSDTNEEIASSVDVPRFPVDSGGETLVPSQSENELFIGDENQSAAGNLHASEVGLSFRPLNLSSFHEEEGYSESELKEYRKQIEEEPRDLSGRSRGVLKRYFSETPVFDLPVGHPVVAFTESQLYHLLRVLSDETVSASWGLLKGLMLKAAGLRSGKTAASSGSRTSHFRKRGRSPTPARQDVHHSSSSSECDQSTTTTAQRPGPSHKDADGETSFSESGGSATDTGNEELVIEEPPRSPAVDDMDYRVPMSCRILAKAAVTCLLLLFAQKLVFLQEKRQLKRLSAGLLTTA